MSEDLDKKQENAWGRMKNSFVSLPKRTKENIKNYSSKKLESFKDFKGLSGKEKGQKVANWLINNALYILIFIFVIVVFAQNTNFLRFDSIVNIITQSASRLIMALGVAGIIVLTGTDLSAGRAMGLCACICASLLQRMGLLQKCSRG